MAKEPYVQGDLDGLCGIYSLVNAAQLIMPDLSEDEAYMMFIRILRFIEKKKRLSRVIVQGVTDKDLNRILRELLQAKYGIKGEQPFLQGRKRVPVDKFIEAIATFIGNQTGAVIISVCSRDWDHWSVVRKITGKEIRFFDSSELCKFRLKCCTTGRATKEKPHVLDPRQTFFLSKVK